MQALSYVSLHSLSSKNEVFFFYEVYHATVLPFNDKTHYVHFCERRDVQCNALKFSVFTTCTYWLLQWQGGILVSFSAAYWSTRHCYFPSIYKHFLNKAFYDTGRSFYVVEQFCFSFSFKKNGYHDACHLMIILWCLSSNDHVTSSLPESCKSVNREALKLEIIDPRT